MIFALGVLLVTSALVTAVFVAVQGDVQPAGHDLAAKQAYYAARAGMNTYLYQLNQAPTTFWTNCANDKQSKTAVPGSTTNQYYSYQPVLVNGSTVCSSSAPISSLIDTVTGTLTLQFEGYVGNVSRGIVVSFRMQSPLDYLWYTQYEALDSSINGYSDCAVYYRNGRSSHCNIQWVTGDEVDGPMYTQDQYLVPAGQTPSFGGAPTAAVGSSSEQIASAAPGNSQTPQNICAGNNCNSAHIVGQPEAGAPVIGLPQDNSQLAADAAQYGVSVSGTTTITLSAGGTAAVVSCTTSSASSCSYPSGFPGGVVHLAQDPIIYASNAPCYTPTSYTPFGATYAQISSSQWGAPYYGCAGDVYVSGYYDASLTIAAANDIVIDDNVTTATSGTGAPTGNAVLGLVANDFVRVMHGVSGRSSTSGSCGGGYGAGNIATQTNSNLVIDAAILNIQHSFIVDNYDCGSPLGNLTINGSIGQDFRGAVGTSSGTTVATGYLKKYTYDSRLQDLLPPYLFEISGTSWDPIRQTLCSTQGTGSAACQPSLG